MTIYPLRVFAVAMLFASGVLTQYAQAQISFTNSGQVGNGSSITGVLTDAAGNSVGYEISNLLSSTADPLFFGWNGSNSSELGGVQHNFGAEDGPVTWLFQLEFDSAIESLTLSQTPVLTSGANVGGSLAIDSDAASATVFAGTQGLGSDGFSNLSNVQTTGGDVSATLAPTTFNDEDDWSITLNNVQTVTVQYDPTSASGIGSEWLTFSNANATISAIPEPSTFFGLTALFTAAALRRRRS